MKLLSRLIVVSIVAAMACAHATGAMAWTVDRTHSLPFNVHLNDNTMAPGTSFLFCPTASADAPEPNNTCGHVRFIATETGPLTVKYTVPSSLPPNEVTAFVCEENPTGVFEPSANCPMGEREVVCTQGPNTANPGTDANGFPTNYIVECPEVTPGTYEVLFVPNSVDSCQEFGPDPVTGTDACLVPGNGITVTGTISMQSISTVPDENDNGKAKGGGTLAPTETFNLHAYGDLRKQKSNRVTFKNDSLGCFFRSTTASATFTFPLLGKGGTVNLTGQGYVFQRQKNSKGNWTGPYTKTAASFTARATDSGSDDRGNGDTFRINVNGCAQTSELVSKGNVWVGRHDDGRDDHDD